MRDDEFEALYAEHAQALFAFLAYRTGDRVLSEDLMAEAFARALRTPPGTGRETYDPTSPPGSGHRVTISDPSSTTATGQLARYLKAIRRRSRLIAVIVIVTVGTALALSLTATKKYDATSKVFINQ